MNFKNIKIITLDRLLSAKRKTNEEIQMMGFFLRKQIAVNTGSPIDQSDLGRICFDKLFHGNFVWHP